MSKKTDVNIPYTSTGRAWPQSVRRYWPLLPLAGMGLLTMLALSSHSTRADGGTWTLPYTGAYSSAGTVVSLTNTGAGIAVRGETDNGTGVVGVSAGGSGVYGMASNGYGVQGSSNYIGMLGSSNYVGVLGNTSGSGFGVVGQGNASGVGVNGSTSASGRAGVEGFNNSSSGSGYTTAGVYGSGLTGVHANGATGVYAEGVGVGVVATANTAILAQGLLAGIYVTCGTTGPNSRIQSQGVYAQGTLVGMYGVSQGHISGPHSSRIGVYGESSENDGGGSHYGVWGASSVYNGAGVVGTGTGAGTVGVEGDGTTGVSGFGDGTAGSRGVYGSNNGGNDAGYFNGSVTVTGTLTAAAKNFKIDHPLDPANKYLVHACVESSEMMNIYRGNVTLDSDGKATVQMPDWFQAENGDFSYQLTCIGGFAPVYVDKELQDNRFEIAGGKAGQKISWQVTGVRQDAYARTHPMQVEEGKTGREKGKYLNPAALGKSETLGVDYDTTQRLRAASRMKAPAPPKMPKTPAVSPAAFKPIRVPAALNLPNSPERKP